MQGQMKSLVEQMARKDHQVSRLDGHAEAHEGKARTLQAQVAALTDQMARKDKEISDLLEAVGAMGDLTSQVHVLKQEMSLKDIEVAGLNDGARTLTTRVEEALHHSMLLKEQEIGRLNRQMSTAQAEIQTLNGLAHACSLQMTTKDREVAALNAQVEVCGSRLDMLTERMSRRDREVESLSSQAATLTGKVQVLKSSVANKATCEFGATVRLGTDGLKNGGGILSGGCHPFDFQLGFAYAQRPDPVVVAWDAPVSIAFVSFRLWDEDQRRYTYDLEFLDPLGVWHEVCRQKQGASWQRLPLAGDWRSGTSVDVSALRWTGINTKGPEIHIVELEAI